MQKKMLLASHQHSHLPADVYEGNSSLCQFKVFFFFVSRVSAKTRYMIMVFFIIGGFGLIGPGLNLVKSSLTVKRGGVRMNR